MDNNEDSCATPSTSSGQSFPPQPANMGHGMHGMWHPYSLPPPQHHPYADRYHHQHYPHYYSHKSMGQHQMQPTTHHQVQQQMNHSMAVQRPVMSLGSSIITSTGASSPVIPTSSLGSGDILRQAIQQSAAASHHHHQPSVPEIQSSGPVLQQVLSHGSVGLPIQPVPGISVASPSIMPNIPQSMPNNIAYPKNKILTRGRLQELVREIDPNEQLDEDVEEMLIQLAEEFVDSALNGACLLAKHRKSNTVDIKDLELHLERNWNMWIPGFGTDELRPYKRSFVTEAHKQRLSLIRKNLKKY